MSTLHAAPPPILALLSSQHRRRRTKAAGCIQLALLLLLRPPPPPPLAPLGVSAQVKADNVLLTAKPNASSPPIAKLSDFGLHVVSGRPGNETFPPAPVQLLCMLTLLDPWPVRPHRGTPPHCVSLACRKPQLGCYPCG